VKQDYVRHHKGGTKGGSTAIDALRRLLLGTPIGNSALLTIAWCIGIILIGYGWAQAIYKRGPTR